MKNSENSEVLSELNVLMKKICKIVKKDNYKKMMLYKKWIRTKFLKFSDLSWALKSIFGMNIFRYHKYLISN